VDFVRRWSRKTEIASSTLVGWIGLSSSKYYDWSKRYGQVNEHNAWIPRDHWVEDWERDAIIAFHKKNPLEGYRRLTFMMLDANVVAVSPSSVYRVLRNADLLRRWKGKPSKKGTGFHQMEKRNPVFPRHDHGQPHLAQVMPFLFVLAALGDGASAIGRGNVG